MSLFLGVFVFLLFGLLLEDVEHLLLDFLFLQL
jgi:hypothetical protein